MKIIFLGTNGWYDTKTGNTICVLIKTGKFSIILDAGNGIHKLGQYIDWKKPAFLFLSHFHLDHIVGLHTLNKFNFQSGLKIYGQKGTKKILNQLIAQPFTFPLNKLPFKTEIKDISEGKYHLPFLVKTKFLVHSSPCLGYRFEIGKKKIAYCTDTDICENLINLAKDVDLLITECSFKPGQIDPNWPHLNPEMAAEIAKKSKVKKLILTHFDANIYKSLSERKETERIVRKIFKNTIAAIDGLEIEL